MLKGIVTLLITASFLVSCGPGPGLKISKDDKIAVSDGNNIQEGAKAYEDNMNRLVGDIEKVLYDMNENVVNLAQLTMNPNYKSKDVTEILGITLKLTGDELQENLMDSYNNALIEKLSGESIVSEMEISWVVTNEEIDYTKPVKGENKKVYILNEDREFVLK